MKTNKLKKLNTQGKTIVAPISAGVITLVVIGLLIFAGPAQAFSIDFGIDGAKDGKYTAKQGEIVKFNLRININQDDPLYLQKLILHLDGETDYACSFYPTGEKIQGCNGINIKLISGGDDYGYGYGYGYNSNYGYGYNSNYGYNNGYGYGYGYGYNSDLVYEITLDTNYFELGTYKTNLEVIVDGKSTIQKGDTLIITSSDTDSDNANPDGSNLEDLNTDTNNTDNDDNDDTQNLSEKIIDKAKKTTSKITGAITGLIGKPATIVASAFIIGICSSALVIRFYRKRNNL